MKSYRRFIVPFRALISFVALLNAQADLVPRASHPRPPARSGIALDRPDEKAEMRRIYQMIMIISGDEYPPASFRIAVMPSFPRVKSDASHVDAAWLIADVLNELDEPFRTGVLDSLDYPIYDRVFNQVYGNVARDSRLILQGSIVLADERVDSEKGVARAHLLAPIASIFPELGGGREKEVEISRFMFQLNALEGPDIGLNGTNQVLANPATSLRQIPRVGCNIVGTHVRSLKGNQIELGAMGSSTTVGNQRTVVDGVHSLQLKMIRRAVCVVLGKTFRVPYWRVIKGGIEDPDVIENWRKEFGVLASQTNNAAINRIARLLLTNGMLDASSTLTPERVQLAAQKFRLSHGLGNSDRLDTDLYVELLRHIALPFDTYDEPMPPEMQLSVKCVGFTDAMASALRSALESVPEVRDVQSSPRRHEFFAYTGLSKPEVIKKALERRWTVVGPAGTRITAEIRGPHEIVVTVYQGTGRVRLIFESNVLK